MVEVLSSTFNYSTAGVYSNQNVLIIPFYNQLSIKDINATTFVRNEFKIDSFVSVL